MTETAPPEQTGESTPLIAYRELVYAEAERLYELAVLLVEDPTLATSLVLRSLDRTWTSLQRDQLFMDIDEAAFWGVVREAAQRRGRSGQVRGFQPRTTSDDRHITAVGILSEFTPEQSAAVYQVSRQGSSYQFAGVASGLGEARARDAVYAARQEYREARERFEPISSECSRLAPLLSARVDDQVRPDDRALVEGHLATCEVCVATDRLYRDFNGALKELRIPSAEVDVVEEALGIPAGRPDQRASRWGRALRMLAGPWGLIPIFIVGAIILRQCSPPPVDIGTGRTSDIVYARASEGRIVALEAGSGQELPIRLPAGVLGVAGRAALGESVSCGGGGCRTVLSATDTGTGATNPIANLEGRLRVAAADQQHAYLADEEAGWNRLIAVSLQDGSTRGSVSAPMATEQAFGPNRPLHLPAVGALYSVAKSAGDESLAVVQTDLRNLQARVAVIPTTPEGVGLSPTADGRRAFVYASGPGEIYEVDLAQGQIIRRGSLRARAENGPLSNGSLIAADPRGELLYCVLPDGGIAVVRADTLEVVRELGSDRRYRAVGVSTDGTAVYALGTDGGYRVLDVETGRERVSRSGVRADDIVLVQPGE